MLERLGTAAEDGGRHRGKLRGGVWGEELGGWAGGCGGDRGEAGFVHGADAWSVVVVFLDGGRWGRRRGVQLAVQCLFMVLGLDMEENK